MKDYVTILHCADDYATARKTYVMRNGRVDKLAYSAGALFKWDIAEVDNVADMFDLLRDIEGSPDSFIIRGKPKDWIADKEIVYRRINENVDEQTGEIYEPTFEMDQLGHHWICVDIDDLPSPSGVTDINELREYVVSQLPAELQNVTYFFQWSNSAGIYGWDALSIHLWFWMAEPRTDAELQAWALSTDIVDDAPFRTVQVNYTARPRFDGVIDPLGSARSGVIEHELLEALVPVVQAPAALQSATGVYKHQVGRGRAHFWDLVEQIGPRLHMPIIRAVASWVASTDSVSSDRNELKRLIRERVQTTVHPKRAHYLTDKYLNQCISSAERRRFNANTNGLAVPCRSILDWDKAKITKRLKGQ